MDENYEEQKLASFNAAMGVVARTNRILDRCWMFREKLDAYLWYHSLKSLQVECWPKMKKQEQEHTDKLINEIKPLINNWGRRSQQGFTGIPDNLYDSLDMLEKTLRTIADKANMLIPNQTSVLEMMKNY